MPAKIKEDISTKNTKNEILDAYQQVLTELKQKESFSLQPEKIKENKAKTEIIREMDEITKDSITKDLDTLKIHFAEFIRNLIQKLDQESVKYAKIKEVIQLKEKELAEIYEIEKEAASLAALLETQKLKKTEFETEMTEKRNALQEEITLTKEIWKQEKEKYERQRKEETSEDKKQREREKEEYYYKFNREKEIALTQLNDEKERLTREIEQKKISFDKEMKDREALLLGRENVVKEKENQITVLEKRVAQFETDMDKAVKQAVLNTEEKNKTEYTHRELLLKKQFEGERNVLTTKIETLEVLVEQYKKQVEQLSQQTEKSYKKLEEIAVKALDNTANTKLMANMESLFKEKNKASE